MANVVVNGGKIRLTVGAGWFWGTGATTTFLDVTLTGTGSNVKSQTNNSVLWADVLTAMTATTGQVYSATAYGVHVGGADGTLLVPVLSPATVSTKMINVAVGVLLDNATGTFTLPVGVPATNSVPSPDPVTPKTGTWAVQDHGQGGTPYLVATS